jgi:hypothetical protein
MHFKRTDRAPAARKASLSISKQEGCFAWVVVHLATS